MLDAGAGRNSWEEDYAELVKRLLAENCASTGVRAPVSQRWLFFFCGWSSIEARPELMRHVRQHMQQTGSMSTGHTDALRLGVLWRR